jgi:hypothetical protein
MSNFLARCAAIGLVGGGFAATGDLGWLAARGMRLMNARTIPAEEKLIAAEAPVSAADQPSLAPEPAGPPPEPDPFRGPPAARPAIPAPDPSPPSNGPERLDLATLHPGERVTFWIGRPTTARQAWITFDLVDPAAGEALMSTPGMAARRVKIRPAGGRTGNTVAKGASVVVMPAGPTRHAAAGGQATTFGPITAIAVGRR